MIFDLQLFTLIHVVISVIGIIAGLVIAGGLMTGAKLNVWTGLFLATTALTSATGFGFPVVQGSPARIVGALSLVLLAVCVAARYWKGMAGGWRSTYVITAIAALYLNVFVLVAQLFAKTPALMQLAPTQKEPPFAVTQVLVLALFVWLGQAALRGSRLGNANS